MFYLFRNQEDGSTRFTSPLILASNNNWRTNNLEKYNLRGIGPLNYLRSQKIDLPRSPSKVQTGHMFPSLPELLQKHAKNYPRVRSQGHFGGWDICCNVGIKDGQHSSAAGWKPQGYSKWLASKSRDLAESSYTKANNMNFFFFRQESKYKTSMHCL